VDKAVGQNGLERNQGRGKIYKDWMRIQTQSWLLQEPTPNNISGQNGSPNTRSLDAGGRATNLGDIWSSKILWWIVH
jgi:hypothetical protein